MVIRYSSLMGHSETGRFTVDTNSLMNNLFLSLRLGMFPNIEGCIFGLSVDVASKLTAELAFNNNADSGVYNLIQPVPMHVEDLIMVTKNLGYNLIVVSVEEYEEKIRKEAENNSFLTIFKDGYGIGTTYTQISKNHPALRRFVESKFNANAISEKCKRLIPNIADRIPHPHKIFHNCILFSSQSGLLERFSIPPVSS
jgi:hypothetical protein